MKKTTDFTEELLCKNTSMDELIKMKMQEELKNAFQRRIGISNKKRINNIKDVPKNKLFSKQTVFKVFNKDTQIETLVNGLQAEALVGMQADVRAKLLNSETDIFLTDNLFVKFEYLEI